MKIYLVSLIQEFGGKNFPAITFKSKQDAIVWMMQLTTVVDRGTKIKDENLKDLRAAWPNIDWEPIVGMYMDTIRVIEVEFIEKLE